MSSLGSTSFPVAESDGNWMNNTPKTANWCSGMPPMETIYRQQRSYNATLFGSMYKYKFLDGRKTCICSNGTPYSWLDNKCFDKIWVGVHGKESMCMVTLKQDLDMTRVAPFYLENCLNHQTLCSYAETVVSEVECLPYNDKFRERFGQSIEKPFGVVSIPCTVHEGFVHEAASAEYDEQKAIDFLKDKMKSNLAFTFDETIQTAISAFQHLWHKELNAEDIWVTTAWKDEGCTDHLLLAEKKEHLAIIRGEPSGDRLRRGFRLSVYPDALDRPGETSLGVSSAVDQVRGFFCFENTPYVGSGGGFTGDFDDEDPPSASFSTLTPMYNIPNAQ